jgi:hypothetical protein
MLVEFINSLIIRLSGLGIRWIGDGGKLIHDKKTLFNIEVKKIKLMNELKKFIGDGKYKFHIVDMKDNFGEYRNPTFVIIDKKKS